MADLEQAASEAVARVRELADALDRARGALQHVEQEMGRVGERLAGDWAELAGSAQALLDGNEEHGAAVAAEAEAAVQAVDTLAAGAAAAQRTLPELAEHAAHDVTDLASHLAAGAAHVATSVEHGAAALHDLAEHAAAIQADLEQALTEARDFLATEVPKELEEMQEAVHGRASALEQILAHDVAASLEEGYAVWEAQLGEVEQILDEELAGARQHAEDVVAYSLDQARHGQEEAWQEAAAALDAVEAVLEKLAAAATERCGEVGEARATLEAALAEARTRLEHTSTVLEHELDSMARYDFVQS